MCARPSLQKRWDDLPRNKQEPITLMHLWLMVFYKLDPVRYAPESRVGPFLNQVLCSAIKNKIGYAGNSSEEIRQRSEDAIMCKGYKEKYVNAQTYKDIYDCLIQNETHAPFLYLNEQYETLRGLSEVDPDAYATKLWSVMLAERDEHDHQSYMNVFQERSPWLFAGRNLRDFDVEQTYKLLTIAIAISLNHSTSVERQSNDALDDVCKKFLYAGPPEELPAFTLREVFDALFPTEDLFAVKRARDDDYVMVKRDNLTYQDQLSILLPWLGAKYDLYPNSEEAAKALLDNNVIDKETADSLRGFFQSFSTRPDPIWNQFVAHLKESLVKCRHAKDLQSDDEADEVIEAELKDQLDSEKIPRKSKSYFNRLSQKKPWNNIAHDKFWDGDQVDISLPEKCEKEEDAEQLYRYIAAHVLIALCCVKADGNATPEKRKEFKSVLIQKINKPYSEVNSALKDAHAKIEKLEQELDKERNDNAEKDRTIDVLVALLNGALNDLHLSSPIKRREYIEVFCQRMGITLDQTSEIDNLVNRYDDPKTRRLTNDSAN